MTYALSGETTIGLSGQHQLDVAYDAVDPDVRRMMQVRKGSRQAFQELVQRYQHRVSALLTRLVGHRRETDDLSQEVFMRVYRARERYTPGARFSTWLFTIVSNVASNARRTLGRRKEVNQFDETRSQLEMQAIDYLPHHWNSDNPAHRLDSRERQSIVRKAIASLNERQQQAVLLNRVNGLSHAEIAEQMETTPKAIKSLLGRAHDTLRSRLQPYMQNGWDIGQSERESQ
jgi:RNA polymerase sigma-70 factor (ECF subfamily)